MAIVKKSSKSPQEDKDMANSSFAIKYGREIAQFFLPDYCLSVKHAIDHFDGKIHIIARVKILHQKRIGKTCAFQIPKSEFEAWRKNLNLYLFAATKPKHID